ncbi:hypothetical protein N8344_01165 [bacterium]|nr:hypothetical protein [bacterium]
MAKINYNRATIKTKMSVNGKQHWREVDKIKLDNPGEEWKTSKEKRNQEKKKKKKLYEEECTETFENSYKSKFLKDKNNG